MDFSKCFFYKSGYCGDHKKSGQCGVFQFKDLYKNIYDIYSIPPKFSSFFDNFSEKKLLESRCGENFPCEGFICAFHRQNYGMYWRESKGCDFPNVKTEEIACSGAKGSRVASYGSFITTTNFLGENNKFSFKGNLCRNHRTYFQTFAANFDQSISEEESSNDEDYDPVLDPDDDDNKANLKDELKSLMQAICCDTVPHVITKPLKNQKVSSKMKIKSAYKKFLESFNTKLFSIWAPNETNEIKEFLMGSTSNAEESINDVRCQELEAFGDAFEICSNMESRLLVLSVINKSSYNFSKDEILCVCKGASMRQINMSRKLIGGQEDLEDVHESKRSKITLDEHKIRHFINFLFSTNSVYQLAYGTSNLSYSSRQKALVAKTILVGLKKHSISDYFEFCSEIKFEHLSQSSLYKIFSIVKPGQQKAIAGLENELVDGLTGFKTLESIVLKYASSEDEPILLNEIEEARRYLKTGFVVSSPLE